MAHNELPRSIEQAARRWQRRRLIVWAVRQALAVALIFWLFPKYPVLWWSLIVIVPLALVTLYQIVRIDRLVEKGRQLDEKLRLLDEV